MNAESTVIDPISAEAGEPGITIVREFAAPRARVWEAWTNPDVMARWFHPETLVTPRESVSVDLRVGGEYTYTMRIRIGFLWCHRVRTWNFIALEMIARWNVPVVSWAFRCTQRWWLL